MQLQWREKTKFPTDNDVQASHVITIFAGSKNLRKKEVTK